jgi:hypothetical protein
MGCRLAESACDSSGSRGRRFRFLVGVASRAAGWSEPDAGWELQPLETNTFYTAHIRSEPQEWFLRRRPIVQAKAWDVPEIGRIVSYKR